MSEYKKSSVFIFSVYCLACPNSGGGGVVSTNICTLITDHPILLCVCYHYLRMP